MEVVVPFFLSIALIGSTSCEEKYIGLYTLGIENTRRQTQNRMQITFFHKVTAYLLTVTVSKKHVIRQNNGSTGMT